jgi:hypothetical protein
MLAELFTTEGEESEWLAAALFRRAAAAYERAGLTREAADCWAAAHDASRAAGLYLRESDYAHAAQLLFSEGRYAEALEYYRRWMSLILPGSGDLVVARLGEAACLTLMRSDRSAARAAYHFARSQMEACDELPREDGVRDVVRRERSLVTARMWEALGAYGLQVGRNDLLQLGYERALARYGEYHNAERLRAARAFATAVKGNRLLAQELEARLAEWDKDFFKATETRRVILDWQGRRFHQGDRVSLNTWAGWFSPQQTNYHARVYANPGCTGSVVEGAGEQGLLVRWDLQNFIRAEEGDLAGDFGETITADHFLSIRNDNKRKVMLDGFESVTYAGHLDIIDKPLTRFWIDHSNRNRDGSAATLERREWVLINPTTWEQRYADGEATEFVMSGRIEVEGDWGTLVVKRDENASDATGLHRDTELSNPTSLEIFIPDMGSRKLWLKMRRKLSEGEQWTAQGEWRDIGEMHVLKDEPSSSVSKLRTEAGSREQENELVCPECSECLKAGTRVCYDCGHRFTLPETLLGTTLDAKYKLVEVLGSGDTTAVYRAFEQSGIGHEFGVKVLLTPLMPGRTVQFLSFADVAGTAMSLHHPGIVRVYDFGSAQLNASGPTVPYFVMELVKGDLLTDLLSRQGSPGLGRRALHLMLAICEAVGEAHRRSIMHLNLEPECVFVLLPEWDDEKGYYRQRVKVMNFGYRQGDYQGVIDTFTGELQGRPVMYMSPEKCQTHTGLDARADVYSLGVLLYEMIAGRAPFVEETPLRIARQHLENPPPPFQPELEVSPRLEAVVMKALSKDRNERQADANALLAELEEVAADDFQRPA